MSACSEMKQYLGWNAASLQTVPRNSTQQCSGQGAGNFLITSKSKGTVDGQSIIGVLLPSLVPGQGPKAPLRAAALSQAFPPGLQLG